ncbi:WAR1 [Candida pseudojiufengensis]|uniref:WAR1 n=1 Tax=Candida pseudojiufengensis TaxID=497109 RepID=UPI002225239F|nr:WAR1 [Candida pseudojiufengensis]KAI5961271.1 WAR1 [Candida pseudojiufengensis]
MSVIKAENNHNNDLNDYTTTMSNTTLNTTTNTTTNTENSTPNLFTNNSNNKQSKKRIHEKINNNESDDDNDNDQDNYEDNDKSIHRQNSNSNNTTTNNNNKPKNSRRSVACKACHALKVKCTPSNPNEPGAPCIRCLNANRKCDIDLNQTRKRRKKAEILEAKRKANEKINNNNSSNSNSELEQSLNNNSHKANKIKKSNQIPNQNQNHNQIQNQIHKHDLKSDDQQPSSSPIQPLQPQPQPQPQSQPIKHHQQLPQQPPQQNQQQPLQQNQQNLQQHQNPQQQQQQQQQPHNITNNDPSSISSVSSPLSIQLRTQQSNIPPISSNLNPLGNSPPSLYTNYLSPTKLEQTMTGSTLSNKDQEIFNLKQKVKFLENQLNQKNHLSRSSTSENHYKHEVIDINSPPFISKTDLEQEITILVETSSKLSELTNELNSLADKRTKLLRKSMAPDVVTKGLLTIEEAEIRLDLYKTRILSFLPFIDVPENLNAEELRIQQPFLFNAVMAASNVVYTSNTPVDLEKYLSIDNEAIRSVCDEVMVVGKKSVELVKSLLILSLYYNSPELFRQRRYHLLNTICVSLLHDLGIVARPLYSFDNKDGAVKKKSEPKTGEEYRALALIIYFNTISICLILRRSIYIKWTPYVEECCSMLENSSEKKYQKLALFARINAALEKIHYIIHSPENGDRTVSTSQFIIQELQKQLTALKKKISNDDHVFLSYLYSVEAYLHEPNLSSIFERDEESGLSANDAKAISNCTKSCLAALNEYSKLSSDQVAQMPLTFGSRVMYTGGMLLRLRYLILSLPSHIEKDLVPKTAVTSIQRVSNLVEKAHIQHPSNYLLKKTKLVLQLFIQTYATQIHDLLRKNGETPQNFKPTNTTNAQIVQKFDETISNQNENGNGTPQPVPLDILSYAASYRREGPMDEQLQNQQQQSQQQNQKIQKQNQQQRTSSETNDKQSKFTPQYLPFTSAGNTPINQINSPPQPQLSQVQSNPIQFAVQPPPQFQGQQFQPEQQPQPQQQQQQQQQHLQPTHPINQTTSYQPQQNFQRNGNYGSPSKNLLNTYDVSTGLTPLQYREFRLPSITSVTNQNNPTNTNTTTNVNTNNNNNDNNNLRFDSNLANQDQLENSYMVLNDEFWSNLLSTDSSDKINFTSSNNINGNQFNDEVFFMN